MDKTREDLYARQREVTNYINRWGHVLEPVFQTEEVDGQVRAITAAQLDEHWDAACDLTEDLFAFYSRKVREAVLGE